MDTIFQYTDQVLLPPQDVRFLKLTVQPWPDRQRVHITLEFSPFQKRPNADIKLFDANGQEISSICIIESMYRQIDFNIYLRNPLSEGQYTIKAIAFYEEQFDKLGINCGGDNQDCEEINLAQEPMIVDCIETQLDIII